MTPELQYLQQLIRFRLNDHFPDEKDKAVPTFPLLDQWGLALAKFVHDNNLNESEASLLLIGLIPHIQPHLFDHTIGDKLPDPNTNFPNIGGVRGKNSRNFLPTGETALFLLADGSLQQRLEVQKLFGAEHLFGKKKILWLEEVPPGEPMMSGRLIISQDYVDTFIYGKPSPPHFSSAFPAKKIEEKRDWNALVISEDLRDQIADIRMWLNQNNKLKVYDVSSQLPVGYRALFHGPSGTGKTLTAGLLGKEMGKDVYKIDLSMVVSKFIGETEKNLELLFSRAEDKGWILFFDEADALFGKRTNVRDAHDKYANQEVSYLLQRIEHFDGLVILASNMKGNIDEAFLRRFNFLQFKFPDANERLMIWKRSFPEQVAFISGSSSNGGETAPGPHVPEELKKYELAGGSIINVVHYACLKALQRKEGGGINGKTNGKMQPGGTSKVETSLPKLTIHLSDVLDGVQKELNKQGKPFV